MATEKVTEKVTQTNEALPDTAEKAKEFGGEKAADAKNEVDAANKEAESQLDAANKSNDPSFADQARQKAAHAREKAAHAQQKMTGAIGDGWAKTKDTFNNLNQYPDKKK